MVLVYKNVKPEQITNSNLPFVFLDVKSEYETLRLEKKDCSMILYNSGKLVVRAKDEGAIITMLSEVGLGPPSEKVKKEKDEPKLFFNDKEHIGSDETLKGDTFGGLVVCAFDYSPELEDKLKAMDVKDSKNLSDDKIFIVAQNLLEYYGDRIKIVELMPEEYNKETEHKTVTKLLDSLHLRLGKMISKEKLHIVDKYPGCSIGDIAITRGEESSLAIAAASIVARYVALKQMKKLSTKAGFVLPKGSTHVSSALDRLLKEGEDFNKYCKLHFSNVKEKLSKAV